MKDNVFYILICVCICFFLASCAKDAGFKTESYENIEAITQSNIKRLDDIKIVFAQDVKYSEKASKAIVFSPKVEGTHQFVDERTFVFQPSAPYEGMSELKMSVDLGLLFEGVAGERGFVKNFIVSPATLFVDLKPLKISSEKGGVEIEAYIETDIPQKLEDLKNLFSVKREDGKTLEEISLEMSPGAQDKSYILRIAGIKRENADFNLIVEYDGSPLGAIEKDAQSYAILKKDSFEILSHRVEDGSTVNIYFSDILEVGPNLGTCCVVESDVSFNYSVSVRKNVLKLHNNIGSWPDNTKVTITKGIFSKSLEGVTRKDYSFVLKDSWDVPYVKFENASNIVPSKENATVLIKTHNIKGIYMQAINIYGHNMLQMLQYETVGNEHDLDAVGEAVWEGSFEFEWRDDMKNRDVVRSIDITELVKKFPTGMFHLKIAFAKKDSMYQAKNPEQDFSHLPFPKSKFPKKYWQSMQEYMEEYGGEVRVNDFWKQRENPLHPAFYIHSYNYNLVAGKDILVSNIALMAKKDASSSIYARVCDIRTGSALLGAEVKAFSFAKRELKSAVTDKEGFVFFEEMKEAAFLVASKDGSVAYLKLSDSAEMEVGHFAVDGQERKEGLKGYIYGERGVWRPGDDIHLCFILQDEEQTLPKDIPLEFSLKDPLYNEAYREVLTSNVSGIYGIDAKTPADAKTGIYTAQVKIGGNTWTRSLRVENIIPNRLFVDLEPKANLKNGVNSIKLKSEWLHGAKASNLKAEVDCSYSIDRAPFEKWTQYSFISETNRNRFSRASAQLWRGVLDDEGIANLNIEMKVENAPGKLKAMFETRVYEDSGSFSVENETFSFSPYQAYIGIMLPEGEDEYRERMLYTNKEQSVDIVAVDSEGSLLKESRECTVELYRLDWRWWWQNDAYDVEALYASSSSVKNVISDKVVLENGRGRWKFNIETENWGRYLLVVQDGKDGHSSSAVIYVDTPYWSRRAGDKVGIAETILHTQAGKEKYNVGDDVVVSFPSAKGSFAYITLERAGYVLDSRILEGTGETCQYTFKATEKMAPNVYVHVSLVQPYQSVQNSLPIRLYGILPVAIEDASTHLEPLVIAEKSFESNKKAKFKVREKNGRQMAFTVAVVDEGLLGLTGFRTANPWNAFYRKEASSIASYDMFNYISGAFGGRIESILAVGGSDLEDGGEGSKKTERFKSVAMLLGPYEIEKGGEKEIEFDMPQYMGAVRLMVVARDGACYGATEDRVSVASPLVVLPTFPRILGIGEEMEVPVTVFNSTNDSFEAKVRLKGEGAIKISEEQKIFVPSMENKNAIFKIKAEKKGKTVFTIEGSGSRGLKDVAFIEIDSISRGTPYINIANELLAGGAEKELSVMLPGEEDSRELFLEISRLPSLGIENRISHLLEKPYRCLEQIVSKAFAQMYLPIFAELSDAEAERRVENIKSSLQELKNFQTASGGFSYWQNEKDASLWVSIYAGHFMVESKKMGFEVEDAMYKKFLEYSADLAKSWVVGYRNDPELQAYRLYVLSLASREELQAMNKLKAVNDLSSLSRSLLASSYILIGKKDVGKNIADGVDLSFVQNERGLRNYNSSVRDVAMKLQTYTLLGEKNAGVNECILALANISSSDEYLSANEIAWIFIGLSPYYNYKKSDLIHCEVLANGETQECTINKTAKVFRLKVGKRDLQNVKVKNKNSDSVYINLTAKSMLQNGEERSEEHGGLSLQARYETRNMERIQNLDDIEKGTRFFIIINAKNTGNEKLEDLVLNLPIPTGWELTNKRMSAITPDGKSDLISANYDYQNFTDTNVYTYFSLKEGEGKQFVFEGVAVYSGNYHIPAIVLESMYNPGCRAIWKN